MKQVIELEREGSRIVYSRRASYIIVFVGRSFIDANSCSKFGPMTGLGDDFESWKHTSIKCL
jgi:hypothetical protein